MTMSFTLAASAVGALDADAMAAARHRQERLVKPSGALGRLEDVSVQLCGIAGRCPAPVPSHPVVVVFAADHGVALAGVTPWPQAVTAQMVAAACAGGAAVSVLSEQIGARLLVVDIGVAGSLPPHPRLLDRKVRAGTADLSIDAAMTIDDVDAALNIGAALAAEVIGDGADLLVTGEMGIGNTTAAAAVIAALTGAPPASCTGRGTGIDDAMLARKVDIVTAGVARLDGRADDGRASGRAVLAEVGGLEIAALAGYIVAGVAARVPVIVDGVITLAALLAAERLAPGVAAGVIAGHRSVEPGASVALSAIGCEPLVDLRMRLGEGTGACLAVPIVRAAAATLTSMASFDDAAVSTPD